MADVIQIPPLIDTVSGGEVYFSTYSIPPNGETTQFCNLQLNAPPGGNYKLQFVVIQPQYGQLNNSQNFEITIAGSPEGAEGDIQVEIFIASSAPWSDGLLLFLISGWVAI